MELFENEVWCPIPIWRFCIKSVSSTKWRLSDLEEAKYRRAPRPRPPVIREELFSFYRLRRRTRCPSTERLDGRRHSWPSRGTASAGSGSDRRSLRTWRVRTCKSRWSGMLASAATSSTCRAAFRHSLITVKHVLATLYPVKINSWRFLKIIWRQCYENYRIL